MVKSLICKNIFQHFQLCFDSDPTQIEEGCVNSKKYIPTLQIYIFNENLVQFLDFLQVPHFPLTVLKSQLLKKLLIEFYETQGLSSTHGKPKLLFYDYS